VSPETVLLRQIHPNFYPDGKLSSQAFFPFPKDASRLSVYNGSLISAANSYDHYTKVLKLSSSCVYGASHAEVADIGLAAVPDPLPDFASHAIIDFTGSSDKEARKLAKKLKMFAESRGCLHQGV
jgi:hypothetical protein